MVTRLTGIGRQSTGQKVALIPQGGNLGSGLEEMGWNSWGIPLVLQEEGLEPK